MAAELDNSSSLEATGRHSLLLLLVQILVRRKRGSLHMFTNTVWLCRLVLKQRCPPCIGGSFYNNLTNTVWLCGLVVDGSVLIVQLLGVCITFLLHNVQYTCLVHPEHPAGQMFLFVMQQQGLAVQWPSR